MQKILIVFILFYQYQNVVTLYTPIDYLMDKLVDFVIDVVDTVIQVKDRLGNMFLAARARRPARPPPAPPAPAAPSTPATSHYPHRNSRCFKCNNGSEVLSTTSSMITSVSTDQIIDSNEWIDSPFESANQRAINELIFKINGNILKPYFLDTTFDQKKNASQKKLINKTVNRTPMPELVNNVTDVSPSTLSVSNNVTENPVNNSRVSINGTENFVRMQQSVINVTKYFISMPKLSVSNNVTENPVNNSGVSINGTENFVPMQQSVINITKKNIYMPKLSVSNNVTENRVNNSGVSINETGHFVPMQHSVINITEEFISMPKLAEYHGKNVESHYVQTKDGYLLTLHHIKPENGTPNVISKAVLLHHGLLGSSADWILLGPNKSLPYILSKSGYDVWLSNARGNYHSRKHVTFKVNSEEFWNFSWHEVGEYDLPATINYIRKLKNNTLLSFVGHSMGASALLVLMSTLPEYNNYLDIGILIAPLAFMGNSQGPFKLLSASELDIVLQSLGVHGEFLPSREVPRFVRDKYCKKQGVFCNNPLFFLSGGLSQSNTTNSSFIDRVLKQVPSGGSLKTVLHYSQLVRNQKFHKFDNESLDYPLTNITLPIAIISSEDDWLATTPDINKLLNNITNLVEHEIIRGKNVSHTEFVWGSTSNKYVHNKIVELLNSPSKSNMLIK